ncbi:MAG: primosomal replication protein N [Sutterellaceae bacterium]|nr:primosomal replication protein N [Sutterellaceae bacterium]
METPVNQVQIRATLIEKKELRYTPAGIAVFEAVFHHCGTQFEAGAERKVEFDFPALSFADVAIRLNALTVGQQIEMKGFFATRSLRSSRLTVHITEFKD